MNKAALCKIRREIDALVAFNFFIASSSHDQIKKTFGLIDLTHHFPHIRRVL